MSVKQAAVVIVGSLNMDFIIQVGQLPKGGETVAGWEFKTLPGGKGANQAYAVGRLAHQQGRGSMIGCVGEDVYGAQLKESLNCVGVNTRHVRATSEAATGVALITVEQGGQNQIVVAAGANHCLKPDEVKTALASLDAAYLLLQLESPIETVEAAARQGKDQGMTVILDPAPARRLHPSLLETADILTPNESEALLLTELSGNEITLDDAPAIARRLLAMGPQRVILKLGDKGVWLADGERNQHFPARQVDAVDTTAAGDCFNGALAVGLSEGMSLTSAINFAINAAAIAVTRCGAQASIPDRSEVEWINRELQPMPGERAGSAG